MHSAGHEGLLLLYVSGESEGEERRLAAGLAAACPHCADFLRAAADASRSARAAACAPPPGLDALVLRKVRVESAAGQRRRFSLALALAAAALALVLAGPWRSREDLGWSNGLDHDMTRATEELEKISNAVTIGADPSELDAELQELEEAVDRLGASVL